MKYSILNCLIILLFGHIQTVFGNEIQWERLVRDRIQVYCHEKDLQNGELIIKLAGASIQHIRKSLSVSVEQGITIVIAPSEKVFSELTGGRIPEWGIAAADPDRGMIYLKSPRFARPEKDLQEVIVHEISHILLGIAAGGRDIPRWFDEGFALYQSGELSLNSKIRMGRSFLTGQQLNLDGIDEVLVFQRNKAFLAYEESRAAMDYLVQRFGRLIPGSLIQSMREGKTLDEAFIDQVGIDLYDFEEEWIQAMKQRYRWAVLLDYRLIVATAMVVLFLAAFLASRKRARQKQRLWETEESVE